jgi:DNA-binding response OmpR family regulator
MKGPNTQPTVLVVDDEEDIADTYSKFLEESYAVRMAYSGEGAIESMSPDVDVVLLDRMMPDMSGDEVLDKIRYRGYDCRIVLVTAVEPALEILSLDFDEYLTKPVGPDDLHEVVESMLARTEYVTTVREAIALASKMATLESKMDIDELEASEEYRQIQRRFHKLREEVDFPSDDSLYTDLAEEKIRIIFDS